MSRVGKQPIELPEGVEVIIDDRDVLVKGPKGELKLRLMRGFELVQKETRLELSITGDEKALSQYHGLMRTLLSNMVVGVTQGFSKVLEVNGVGFRVAVAGQKITLNLGYSHPIEYTAPEGVALAVDQTTITISGIDKQKVGEVAAEIRAFRPPEPYKGKGIKYSDEVIRRKVGKAAAKATGAGA